MQQLKIDVRNWVQRRSGFLFSVATTSSDHLMDRAAARQPSSHVFLMSCISITNANTIDWMELHSHPRATITERGILVAKKR